MIDVKTKCGPKPVPTISDCVTLDKAISARLNVEIQERKDADIILQQEIDDIIISGGSVTIEVVQNSDGTIVIRLKNKNGDILSYDTITTTGSIVKSASLVWDSNNSKIVFTRLNDSTFECDLSNLKTYIVNGLETKADLVNGKVPSSQLPSYVDDVLEFPTFDDFPQPGESGIIYVALDTGHTYRWSGSEYIEIGGGLEIIPVSDSTTLLEIPDDYNILQYDATEFFISNKIINQITGKINISLQNHNGVYKDYNLNSSTTLEEILTEDNYYPYIMTYIDEDETPNNEKGLYRYVEEDAETGNDISSHIVEVVKEDHSGGEVSYEKTTTSNNTSLNADTFMSQFDSELSNFISVSSVTNVYSLYYSGVPFNGIRIGTINLTVLQDCDVVIYKYFSYNGQTGVKTYDANSRVLIDQAETIYDFDDDETPVIVHLTAGEHGIESNGNGGRLILTAFEVVGEPYSTFEKKELARTEEVQAVQDNLDDYIEETTTRFIADEKLIQKNADDIVLTNNKIGDIQLYQVVYRLPNPSEQYSNKILRYNEKLYQCVRRGDGVHKDWPFDVSGTSEIVYGTDGRTYEAFMNEVGNEFKDYYEIPTYEEPGEESGETVTVLDASKLFRNNGTIRLGSSSAVGNVVFQSIADLPITSLKVGVKAYRADRPSCIYIEDNSSRIYPAQLIENSVEETLISLTYENEDDLDYLYLESLSNYTDTSGDEPVTIQCDKRVIITRIIADFGDVHYEWKEVGGSPLLVNVTYAELKELRDNAQLIPGQQYRITDYNTTTVQFDTKHTHHNFDIIVTADSEKTLNENARAVNHNLEEVYSFESYENGWILIRYPEADGIFENEKYYAYKDGSNYCYLKDIVGDVTAEKVYLFINDNDDAYVNISEATSFATYLDYEGSSAGIENIVRGGYFHASNFNAWEIKYSLDNNSRRFIWSVDKDAIRVEEPGGENFIYIRYPEGDTDNTIAWVYYNDINLEFFQVSDWSDVDTEDLIFSEKYPEIGDVLDMNGIDVRVIDTLYSRGVIYYMKDEYNNEASYDFKNIQFRRYLVSGEEGDTFGGKYVGIVYESGSKKAPYGTNYSIDDLTNYIWCYTFNLIDENDVCHDSSIEQRLYRNDDNGYSYTSGNNLTKASLSDSTNAFGDYSFNDIFKLPNIVFNVEYDEITQYGFTGPSCNSFEHNCYDNTFGSTYCVRNHFGNNCYWNTFAVDCDSNIFHDYCYSNNFSTYCHTNTFEHNCHNNIFDENCNNITFKSGCGYNVLSNSCANNTLEDNCLYNNLSANCSDISFGKNVYSVHISSTPCRFIMIDSNCRYLLITAPGSGGTLQNLHIHSGIKGQNSTYRKGITVARDLDYTTDVYPIGSTEMFI